MSLWLKAAIVLAVLGFAALFWAAFFINPREEQSDADRPEHPRD